MTAPKHIEPAAVRSLWADIEWMIEVVRKAGNERWITADVFVALVTGRADLFVAYGSNEKSIKGVIILDKVVEWNVPVLNVWICFHRDQTATIADFVPWLKDFAAKAQCKRVAWRSPRRYERAVPGARMVETKYELELSK